MSRARIRPLLAAIAVVAILGFALSGHGTPQMSHEQMAGAAAGLCLLLATAVAFSAAPKPTAAHEPAVAADRTPSHVPWLERHARREGARVANGTAALPELILLSRLRGLAPAF